MIDINFIRENPEKVRTALLKKMDEVDFTELLKWDEERRGTLKEVEELKARKNSVSKEVATLKKEGKEVTELYREMKEVSSKIKEYDEKVSALEEKIEAFVEPLPNIPDEDVLPGGKENNKVVKTYGQKPEFNFTPKDHVELAKLHKLIDYERGTKLSGNGFWIYRGKGALLEWALLNYFVEEHTKDGYEFILPPHILNYECGLTAGQFPKFEGEVFTVREKDKEYTDKSQLQFMLPTAETALLNLFRGEILEEAELPKKLFAYTPCYRVEAGSYRKSERGMIRGHQFNKVEMFQFVKPEDSDAALEELIRKAERLVEGLGLHYRTSKLAAKDCSASMAKTFDIEIWIPSMNEYKEVSSASNARSYQARRGKIRFRRKDSKKLEYINTLNASGLATSRLLPAILEQCQREDGSIVVPEVLRKWVGVDIIK